MPFRTLVAAAMFSVTMTACQPSVPKPAASASPAPAVTKPSGKLSSALEQLASAHASNPAQAEAQGRQQGLAIVRGAVGVELAVEADAATLRSELEALGMRDIRDFGRLVSGYMPIGSLRRLEDVHGLRLVRETRAVAHPESMDVR